MTDDSRADSMGPFFDRRYSSRLKAVSADAAVDRRDDVEEEEHEDEDCRWGADGANAAAADRRLAAINFPNIIFALGVGVFFGSVS